MKISGHYDVPIEVQLVSSELSRQWLEPSQTRRSGIQERPSPHRNWPSPHSTNVWNKGNQKQKKSVITDMTEQREKKSPIQVTITTVHWTCNPAEPETSSWFGYTHIHSYQLFMITVPWLDGQSRSSEPSAQSREPSHFHLFGRQRFSFSHRNSSSRHRLQANSSSPWLQSCRPSHTHRSGMQVLSLLQRYSFGKHSPSGAIQFIRISVDVWEKISGQNGIEEKKEKWMLTISITIANLFSYTCWS